MILLSAGRRLLGVSVAPSNGAKLLADVIQKFTIFALHPHCPYAAYFIEVNHIEQDLIFKGYQFDLLSLQKRYTTDVNFPGPFTFGIRWQEVEEVDELS